VAEVNSGLQQLLDAYLGHLPFLSLWFFGDGLGGSSPRLMAAVGTRVVPGQRPIERHEDWDQFGGGF
jgi:hypothetical protein